MTPRTQPRSSMRSSQRSAGVLGRRPLSRLLAAGAALTALAALTGCGELGTEEPVKAAGQRENGKKPRKPDSPAPTVSESSAPSPTPAPSPTSSGPVTLEDRLLTADEVPGFNEQFAWSDGTTSGTEPATLAGTCHQFEMLSIGATDVAYRDYQPDQGTNSAASELVAEFADEKTAGRAFEVLTAWRERCDKALSKYDSHQVGALQDVPVDGIDRTAHWYMLTYGPAEGDAEAVYFDAEGLALVGRRIAVVRMALIGQDHNYDAGEEPMVRAVQAAAGKLT